MPVDERVPVYRRLVETGRGRCRAGISGLLLAAMVAGCVTTPVVDPTGTRPPPAGEPPPAGAGEDAATIPPTGPAATQRPGGYYRDDGPGARDPAELDVLAAGPDPVPIAEPLHSRANRPYRLLGTDYRPMTRREPFRQRGVASWYGRKFHGQLTSTGERYDMYQMSAAHPTLPIPSFARVTNLENGRSAVVRVNDRGPFLHGRAIDLSYLAAHKLGYASAGSTRVEVELLDPARFAPSFGSAQAPTAAAAATATAAATAAAAEVTADATATTVSPGAGHYLQLGAFGTIGNAQAASTRLRQQLEWLRVPIEVTPSDGLYRVQAGPYDLREQAASAAAQVASKTGLRPLLLPR